MSTVHTIADMRGGPTDDRTFFKRGDGSIYAILSMSRVRTLRKRRLLDKFLQLQRQSGVVIQVAGH